MALRKPRIRTKSTEKPISAPIDQDEIDQDEEELDEEEEEEEADDDDDDNDDEPEEEEQDEPDERLQPARKKNGRPRTKELTDKGPFSVTLVIKNLDEYNEFLHEAQAKKLSASAYALQVVQNRSNTVEFARDIRKNVKYLRDRVAQLEGAKETLQALFDQERAGKAGGLSGLDDENAPMTTKSLNKAVAEALAKRDAETRLKELEELEKDYEKLEKEHETLLEKHEKVTSFSDIAEKLAPAAMNIASTRFGPQIAGFLGMLSGVPAEPLALAGADPSDPLMAAVLRTRDNISPKQGRDLEQVMDAIARNPQFVERFAAAVQQFDKASQAGKPAYPDHPIQ